MKFLIENLFSLHKKSPWKLLPHIVSTTPNKSPITLHVSLGRRYNVFFMTSEKSPLSLHTCLQFPLTIIPRYYN